MAQQMQRLYGSHWLLRKTPIWLLILVIYLGTVAIAPFGRWLFEGHAYAVSYSNQIGDVFLAICFAIAATSIQRHGVLPNFRSLSPNFLSEQVFHDRWIVLAMLVMIGEDYWMWRSAGPQQILDIVHNAFLVPVFVYFAGTTFWITFHQGRRIEILATTLLLLGWAALVVLDYQIGRLDQLTWLKIHCGLG